MASTTSLRKLINGFDFSVALLARDGTILATNDAWAEFGQFNGLEAPPDSVGENYLTACSVGDDPFTNAATTGIEAVLAGERDAFRLEYPCHSPDEKRWFLLYAGHVELSDAAGIVSHIDITGRKVSELTVHRRNQELETLASILSHDLRNPLTVAKGWAELLDETADDEMLDELREALDRMERIIEDALSFVRAGRGVENREEADLETLAERAWRNVETAEATLEVTGTTTLHCVPGLVENVFENLFHNSVEHGGTDVRIRVGTTADGFFIEDDGPGIPADVRDRVFDFGYSGGEGTGLGLAIVRSIVGAHGWDVHVAEAAGGGARFVVTTHPLLPEVEVTLTDAV